MARLGGRRGAAISMIRWTLITLLLAVGSVARAYDFTTNLTTQLPIKWPAGSVTLQLKVDAVTVLPGDGSTRETSIQGAAEIWNTCLGAVQFAPRMLNVGNAGYANGRSEVVFAPTMFGQAFDARTLAVTFLRSNGNAATERDVIFNSNLSWDSYRGSLATHGGGWDIQRVAIHELGHVLGLDHPDQATPPQTVAAIMNSIVSDTTLPTADDISGVQVLYGPPGVPANDLFSQAAELVLANHAARATGYNTNATKEAGEPPHAGNVGGRSIWWKWTAPANGTVSLSTQGSIFDTTLGVYRGTALASLVGVAANDDLQARVIQYSTVSFSASGATTYHFAVDGFDGDTGQVVLNLGFTPDPVTAPVILSPPSSQTVPLGTAVTLVVSATGVPVPTYQWRKEGVPLPGATNSSLVFNSVATADAGQYTVAMANTGGSVISGAAVLAVVDVRATQAVAGTGYLAGGNVTLIQSITYAGPCTGLDWRMLPPAGWSYLAGGGAEGPVRPAVGTTDLLEWTWTTVPVSPVTFTVTLHVPAGQSGDQVLSSLAVFRVATGLINLLAKPDPLVIALLVPHTADIDRDFRISLLELTRVIELYNTRNGTTRTGAYKVDTAGEDGFNAEPTRPSSTPVTLTRYHGADTDRNGQLNLLELTRVIELYNTREGTTRTGAYHPVRSGEAVTEDGFRPGP